MLRSSTAPAARRPSSPIPPPTAAGSTIDAATGAIRDRSVLDGPGRKYIRPAVVGEHVFVMSCTGGPDEGNLPGASHLEAWDLIQR